MRAPGVVSAAIERVVRIGAEGKFGRVGASDHDDACLLQVFHHRGVMLCDDVTQGEYPVRRCMTGLIDVDLDGDGEPVQRAGGGATGAGLVERHRAFHRLIAEVFDNGVQVGVHRVHPCDGGADGGFGAQLSTAGFLGGFGRAEAPDRIIGHVYSPARAR